MATKKTTSSTKKSVKKNFVLKFHSCLTDSDNTYDTPMFYSESGQGWVNDIGSATRYSENGADGRILELLKEEKIASELLDLDVKPENSFACNTVFIGPSNIPHIITKVPQFVDDTYSIGYHDPHNGFMGDDWSEEDLVDMLKEEHFTILWDSDGSFVPEDTESWLNGLFGES